MPDEFDPEPTNGVYVFSAEPLNDGHTAVRSGDGYIVVDRVVVNGHYISGTFEIEVDGYHVDGDTLRLFASPDRDAVYSGGNTRYYMTPAGSSVHLFRDCGMLQRSSGYGVVDSKTGCLPDDMYVCDNCQKRLDDA